ncbi:unnamed protein product [Cuscuta epithymum]|uniref:Uncharacterized protein n=1 Tax=Cuscuta epithymum TaxID=186058 RepID=A0AAV0C209_9ASTE|nr:unnamed protein product [Cuscuta epithymum]
MQLVRVNVRVDGEVDSRRRQATGVSLPRQSLLPAPEGPHRLHLQLRRNGLRRRRFRHQRRRGAPARPALLRPPALPPQAPPSGGGNGRIGRQGQLRVDQEPGRREEMRVSRERRRRISRREVFEGGGDG